MLVLRGTVGWAVGMGDGMGHLRADGAACVQDEEHLCQEVTASDAELFALGWEGSRDKLHLSLTACSTRHLVPEAFVHDLLFLCGHHVTERPHSELWGCQSHPAPLPLAGPCPLSDPDSESRPSTAQLSQGPAGLTLFLPCPFNENIIFFSNQNQSQNPMRLQPTFWRVLESCQGCHKLSVTAQSSSRPVLAEVAGDTALDAPTSCCCVSPSSHGTSPAGESRGT